MILPPLPQDAASTAPVGSDAHPFSFLFSSSCSAENRSTPLKIPSADELLEHYQTVLKELTHQALEQQEEIHRLKNEIARNRNEPSPQAHLVAFEHQTGSEGGALFELVDKMVREAAEHYLKEIDKRLSSSMAQRVRRVTREHVRQSILHAVEDELAYRLRNSHEESLSNAREPEADHDARHEMKHLNRAHNSVASQCIPMEVNTRDSLKKGGKKPFIAGNRSTSLARSEEGDRGQRPLSRNEKKCSQIVSVMHKSASTLRSASNAGRTARAKRTWGEDSTAEYATIPEVSSISSPDDAETWEGPNHRRASYASDPFLSNESLGCISRELRYDTPLDRNHPPMTNLEDASSTCSEKKRTPLFQSNRHTKMLKTQLTYPPQGYHPTENPLVAGDSKLAGICDDPMDYLLNVFSARKFGHSENARLSPFGGIHRSGENPATEALRSDTTDRLGVTHAPKGGYSEGKTNGLSSFSSPAYRSNDPNNTTLMSSFVSEVTFRSKNIGLNERESFQNKKMRNSEAFSSNDSIHVRFKV